VRARPPSCCRRRRRGRNGGPSVQLVSPADGPLTMDANATLRHTGGRSRTGGPGGKGTRDNNAGPPGNGGVSADQMSILLGQEPATASNSSPGAPPAYAVDGDPDTARCASTPAISPSKIFRPIARRSGRATTWEPGLRQTKQPGVRGIGDEPRPAHAVCPTPERADPGSRRDECESAPKRDPTSDRPQLLGTLKEILFRVGSRSAPIRTPTSGVLSGEISDLLLFGRGPASVLIHSGQVTTSFGRWFTRACERTRIQRRYAGRCQTNHRRKSLISLDASLGPAARVRPETLDAICGH
jgi:hypothetical protein